MCSFDTGGENLEVVAWKPSATLDKKRKSPPSPSTELSNPEVQIMWCQWMLLNLYPIDWTLAHLCFALLRGTLQCIVGKVYGDFHSNSFLTFRYLTLEQRMLWILPLKRCGSERISQFISLGKPDLLTSDLTHCLLKEQTGTQLWRRKQRSRAHVFTLFRNSAHWQRTQDLLALAGGANMLSQAPCFPNQPLMCF